MANLRAGLLNAFDVGKRHRFSTRSGQWQYNSEEYVEVLGVITMIQHKKDGDVRLRIGRNKNVSGLHFGAELMYDRHDPIDVLEESETE